MLHILVKNMSSSENMTWASKIIFKNYVMFVYCTGRNKLNYYYNMIQYVCKTEFTTKKKKQNSPLQNPKYVHV